MLVDLSQIQQEPKTYYLHLPEEWWLQDVPNDQIRGLYEPVYARLTIEKIGKRFMVRGELKTTLMLQCDRCLDLYARELTADFHLFLEPLSNERIMDEEVELADEEMGVDLVPGQIVELEHIIKEQIYLSIPMKTLCKEDCLGLCPTCGVNRNKEKCSCHVIQGHPAFQGLRKLL